MFEKTSRYWTKLFTLSTHPVSGTPTAFDVLIAKSFNLVSNTSEKSLLKLVLNPFISLTIASILLADGSPPNWGDDSLIKLSPLNLSRLALSFWIPSLNNTLDSSEDWINSPSNELVFSLTSFPLSPLLGALNNWSISGRSTGVLKSLSARFWANTSASVLADWKPPTA